MTSMAKWWLHFSDLKRTRGKIPRLSYRPQIETLEERALLSGDTWYGLGGNGNWSNPANWNNGVPNPGDDLAFSPSGPFTPTNDLTPGMTFGSLSFNTDFTMQGNAIVLTGGISG